MKTINKVLVLCAVGLLICGCASNNNQNNKEFLASLTEQQQFTLLTMLESYEDNRRALEAWRESEPSVSRLVELESDLKLLIIQLNELAEKTEESLQKQPQEQAVAAKVESQDGTQPTQTPAEVYGSEKFQNTPQGGLGGYTVQLTAVTSMNDLRNYWTGLQQQFKVMFAEATPFYQTVTDASGRTFYRLKVGRFNSKKDAEGFCGEFSESGRSCFVTADVSGDVLAN